ncbi:hypothetical protein MNBD_GAMMA10-2405 [hydrothermal vent metagenome]|uniref:HTH cro/C1-type domain-containing protein n=1 Tax=hydrothermal vent metagenome TaxID=652676 RepID=A0A3B0XW54_9ZZZZ
MFGEYLREQRELLRQGDKRYSLRQVSQRAGIEPTYLSKIEREELPPPSEQTIKKLSQDLCLDADILLAMAGKVSADLREIICKRPQLFAELIRQLKKMPDQAVVRVVREATDGNW